MPVLVKENQGEPLSQGIESGKILKLRKLSAL
jgi:hypothetical protein